MAVLLAACLISDPTAKAISEQTFNSVPGPIPTSSFGTEAVSPQPIAAFPAKNHLHSLTASLNRQASRYEKNDALVEFAVGAGNFLGRLQRTTQAVARTWTGPAKPDGLPATFWMERIDVPQLLALNNAIDTSWAAANAPRVLEHAMESLRIAKFNWRGDHTGYWKEQDALPVWLRQLSFRDSWRIENSLKKLLEYFSKSEGEVVTLMWIVPLDAESADFQLVLLSRESRFLDARGKHVPIHAVIAPGGELEVIYRAFSLPDDFFTVTVSDTRSKNWFVWQ